MRQMQHRCDRMQQMQHRCDLCDIVAISATLQQWRICRMRSLQQLRHRRDRMPHATNATSHITLSSPPPPIIIVIPQGLPHGWRE